ncbi:hypothetical protein HJG60_011546 [Phyllostomus discolor]|uniref:Uncharacterized protein n=1 Tax=Phyllostomus discolor TaxID=89673 RepID=A0A833ZY83_9CHIR|nr:hypothetical protein HJG60_011546 [Phyllostomus discolor]
MKVSWTEILKRGMADGPIRERHMEGLRTEIVFNRKVTALTPGWGGTEHGCQNQALPRFMLQMALSAAEEGAFGAACPHLTSYSSAPRRPERKTEERLFQICGGLLYLQAKGRSLGCLRAFVLSNLIQTLIKHLLSTTHVEGTLGGGKWGPSAKRETTTWTSKKLNMV